MMKKPIVSVVMGNNSDWKVMSQACEVLKEFGIPHNPESSRLKTKSLISWKQ